MNHYKRCHLSLELEYKEIPCSKPGDSPHYAYIAKKKDGADKHSEENWHNIDAEILKEDTEAAIKLGLM